MAGLGITNAYDTFLRRSIHAFSTNSSSPAFTSIYAYDAASRLSSVSDGTYSAAYGYLANSPLVNTVTFKQNSTVRMTTTKTYDFLNRLGQISSVPSASSVVNYSYLYNSANQRTERREPDSSFWLYQYDSLGQVTSGKKYWSDWTPFAGQQFEYVFDDIGNRSSTKAGGDSTGANLRTANYTANNLNQYTQRDVPGTVDIIGVANAAATATVNGQSTYRKVEYYQKALAIANSSTNVWQSVSNQAVLAGATNITAGNIFVPKTPESFAYDADGNETNDGRWSFIWDAENRPLTMLSSNVVDGAKKKLDFLYDWRGRRRTKVVSTWNGSAFSPASTNRFVYDDWNLVAEMDATNNLIRSYLWGLDLSGSLQGAGGVGGLIAVNVATNGFHFAAYDGNGNIVALLKATDGTISANYEYGPFGELIRSSGAAASANPCRLSTKYTDDESDFLYYGYRFYNSSSGRWLNRDPIMEYGGLDLEQFAAGDPINTIDALGLRTLVLNFGFDNSAPWNEQSGTRQDINRNLEFLKGVIKKCCDTFKIGCDITVKANYDFGTGMFDEGNKPAPKNGYDFSDLTLYLANLNKITAPEDGVKILITERSITAFQGKTKAGGWTTGGGILLNVNPPQDGGAGAGGVAHELGHYCGYACGDYKLPSGVTDTGHSSDPTNPMYFANSKGNVPDECYCKGIDKKAK